MPKQAGIRGLKARPSRYFPKLIPISNIPASFEGESRVLGAQAAIATQRALQPAICGDLSHAFQEINLHPLGCQSDSGFARR
jgi:hypothetical protein